MCKNLNKYIPFLIFFVSLVGILMPYGQHGGLPGDVGDGRFNRYILEHFYLVLSGKENSFLNAPFFYPWIKTISFSDTYWGNGWVYALFRSPLFQFTPEKSYLAWFDAGFILNYWIGYYVNRRLGLGQLGAAMGAFLFTFSLPMLFQDGHPQLVYRFYVPLAFLTLHLYLRARDPRLIATTALLVALQLLTSLYIGVFLCYFLAAYLIVWRFSPAGYAVDHISAKLSIENLKLTGGYTSCWIIAAILFLIAISIFLLVAIPYLQVQHLYGFNRSWGEISSILPRIQSYFMAEHSSLWFSDVPAFFNVSANNEQQLFIGIGSLGLFLYAILAKNFLQDHPLSRQMLFTVAIIVIVTLYLGDFSFYRVLTSLPGVSSIRSVARIILVLIFPLGIVIGQVLDQLNQTEFKLIKTTPFIFILCFIVIVDSIVASKHISSANEWNDRMTALASRIKDPITKDSILVVADTDPAYKVDIDAMIFSQLHGIKTINGYSGNQPLGYTNMYTCKDVEKIMKTAEKFYQDKLSTPFKIDRSKIIYVGFPEDCHRINK